MRPREQQVRGPGGGAPAAGGEGAGGAVRETRLGIQTGADHTGRDAMDGVKILFKKKRS